MDNIVKDTIKVGKYTFSIIDKTTYFRDSNIIAYRGFKIGGDYDDCINIAYVYNNGEPIEAKLPHLMYEPECSIGSNLEKGGGSETMIKAIINYAYNKIPSITKFYFDDMSHIDCIEKDMTKPVPRKQQKPLNLAMLSIAYNSQTWYEKYFNASMKNKELYSKYRERVSFLHDPDIKVSFERFIEIARPPTRFFDSLETYYKSAKTYRDFFKNIPYEERCLLLLPWLENFIMYYLQGVYNNMGWEINVLDMNNKKGGSNKTRKHKKRKNISYKNSLYPSHYKLINYIPYSML